jgi:hypothetical protein
MPNSSHAAHVLVWRNKMWQQVSFDSMVYEFCEVLRRVMHMYIEVDRLPEWTEHEDRFERLCNWFPDEEEDLKVGDYDELKQKIRAFLLGNTRKEIRQLRKAYGRL